MSDLWRIVDIDQGRHVYVNSLSSFDQVENGIVFHCETNRGTCVNISLQICTPEILRLRMSPDSRLAPVKSLLEIKEDWGIPPFEVSQDEECIRITTTSVVFEVLKYPWKWFLRDKTGQVVVEEEVNDLDVTKDRRSLPLGFFLEGDVLKGVNETIRLTSDEHYFGLGEKFIDLDRRHQNICCWNLDALGSGTEESYKNIPFLMSTKGFGLFLNTTFLSIWEMGSRSLVSSTIQTSDATLDLFLIYGPDLKSILSRYTEITGRAPLPPKKSFGIQASLGWGSIEPAARKFRKRGIPIDLFRVLNQIQGWPDWDEMIPVIEGTLAFLERRHIKGTLYTTPYLPVGSLADAEARKKGFLVRRKDGTIYEDNLGPKPNGHKGIPVSKLESIDRTQAWRESYKLRHRLPNTIVDFTNPQAVAWWMRSLEQLMGMGFYAVGMSDMGEDAPVDGVYYNGRSGWENHNIYPLLYNQAVFKAVAEYGTDRPMVNARSGYAGMQKYPICWSGRPNCTYADLGATIRGGQSIGLSGVPFWTSDTGGNWGEPSPDLYIRWAQFSMFCSHVFLHGDGDSRLPWKFGEQAVEIFKQYARLRYQLFPYIYSYAYAATQQGLPLIRAMTLEFEGDPFAFQFDLQYMFGEELLVAPVYHPNGQRPIYLPSGGWFDYFTGEFYQGLTTIQYQAPLDRLPLFVRENAIIPMGPEIEWIDNAPFKEIILQIWLNDRASFDLYDDDGLTHIAAQRSGQQIMLDISPSERAYTAHFHHMPAPLAVTLSKEPLEQCNSAAEFEQQSAGWWADDLNTVWVKFNSDHQQVHLVLEGKEALP